MATPLFLEAPLCTLNPPPSLPTYQWINCEGKGGRGRAGGRGSRGGAVGRGSRGGERGRGTISVLVKVECAFVLRASSIPHVSNPEGRNNQAQPRRKVIMG
jgi:hypothetical protein